MLALAFTMQACSDDDTKTVDNGVRTGNATKLEIYKDSVVVNSLTFSIGKGSAIVGIDADGEWTAESADTTWCKLNVHAGYGYVNKYSYTKIDVAKNEGDQRSTTISFRSGGITKTINVVQNGSGTDPNDPFISAFTFDLLT